MIYLYQNNREYDYDVRAIALAFFEREKIIELPEEEFEAKLAELSEGPKDLDSGEESKSETRFFHLYFEEEKITDIHILDNPLPGSKMMQYVNTFLCVAEYEGKCEVEGLYQKFDTYTILEWYPVYPVVRDSLIPVIFLPKSFMTRKDIPFY